MYCRLSILQRKVYMGKQKKKKSPVKRIRSKWAKPIKIVLYLLIGLGSFIILAGLFWLDFSVPVSLFYTFMFMFTLLSVLLLTLVLCSSLERKQDRNATKGTIFLQIALSVILVLIMYYFMIPQLMDFSTVLSGNYQKVTGTVEEIQLNGSYRGINIPREIVRFREDSTGAQFEITFNGTRTAVNYGTKTIYYLPATHWGAYGE